MFDSPDYWFKISSYMQLKYMAKGFSSETD